MCPPITYYTRQQKREAALKSSLPSVIITNVALLYPIPHIFFNYAKIITRAVGIAVMQLVDLPSKFLVDRIRLSL